MIKSSDFLKLKKFLKNNKSTTRIVPKDSIETDYTDDEVASDSDGMDALFHLYYLHF